jgi:hypothetical protein
MNDMINQTFDQATEKLRKFGENIEELPKTVACLVNGKNEFNKEWSFMWLNNALKLLWGKIRRQFLVCCKPTAVQTVLAERRGECLQCAKCCRLLFKCPFLSAENLCLIYKSTLRPKSCVHFPLSRADLEDVKTSSGHGCGYHFIFR